MLATLRKNAAAMWTLIVKEELGPDATVSRLLEVRKWLGQIEKNLDEAFWAVGFVKVQCTLHEHLRKNHMDMYNWMEVRSRGERLGPKEHEIIMRVMNDHGIDVVRYR